MLTAEWIFGWWNLVFLAPFLLALIYLGVYAASGVTFGDADADADLDADADIDADSELSTAAHGEIGTDAGTHAEIGHESDLHASGHTNGHAHGGRGGASLFTALTWLGLGRVPLSIVLMVLFFTWGAVGFAINVLARELFPSPGRLLLLSLPAALAGSLVLTGAVSTAIVKLIPLNETSARRRHALLGSVGEAIFTIDQAGGVVVVRDAEGNLAQVAARPEPGAAAIVKGSKVRLVAYDGPRKLFFAQPTDPHAAAVAGGAAVNK